MIELQWWVLLLAALTVYSLGQVTGMLALIGLAKKVSDMQDDKKLNKRYPEGVH